MRIDRAKVKAEQWLDGKFLPSTSDLELSAEDVALGYKNLLEAERGYWDFKSSLELCPVFHRLVHRIHAHVLLCWLALLLIRVTELSTGQSCGEASRSSSAVCTRSPCKAPPAWSPRPASAPPDNATRCSASRADTPGAGQPTA